MQVDERSLLMRQRVLRDLAQEQLDRVGHLLRGHRQCIGDDVERRVAHRAAIAEPLSERQRLTTERFLGGGECFEVLLEFRGGVLVPVTDHVEGGGDQLALPA